MLNSGNLVAHRTSLSPRGYGLLGPVEPKHPPRTLVQMMKNRLVSIDFPGPTKSSHHPGLEEVEGETSLPRDATWDDAERPVWRRMALDLSRLRVPHVSYAIWYGGGRGCGE
jgi:hypothetical protein